MNKKDPVRIPHSHHSSPKTRPMADPSWLGCWSHLDCLFNEAKWRKGQCFPKPCSGEKCQEADMQTNRQPSPLTYHLGCWVHSLSNPDGVPSSELQEYGQLPLKPKYTRLSVAMKSESREDATRIVGRMYPVWTEDKQNPESRGLKWRQTPRDKHSGKHESWSRWLVWVHLRSWVPGYGFSERILYSDELLHFLELIKPVYVFVCFRDIQASRGPMDSLHVSTRFFDCLFSIRFLLPSNV